jgi:GTP-binding protein
LVSGSIEKMKTTLAETWENLPPYLLSSAVSGDGREEILSYIGNVLKTAK